MDFQCDNSSKVDGVVAQVSWVCAQGHTRGIYGRKRSDGFSLSSAAPYSLMYRLGVGQWGRQRPQFHKDAVSSQQCQRR